jgi:hypothetical protein
VAWQVLSRAPGSLLRVISYVTQESPRTRSQFAHPSARRSGAHTHQCCRGPTQATHVCASQAGSRVRAACHGGCRYPPHVSSQGAWRKQPSCCRHRSVLVGPETAAARQNECTPAAAGHLHQRLSPPCPFPLCAWQRRQCSDRQPHSTCTPSRSDAATCTHPTANARTEQAMLPHAHTPRPTREQKRHHQPAVHSSTVLDGDCSTLICAPGAQHMEPHARSSASSTVTAVASACCRALPCEKSVTAQGVGHPQNTRQGLRRCTPETRGSQVHSFTHTHTQCHGHTS